jgi:hypothetical protein
MNSLYAKYATPAIKKLRVVKSLSIVVPNVVFVVDITGILVGYFQQNPRVSHDPPAAEQLASVVASAMIASGLTGDPSIMIG